VAIHERHHPVQCDVEGVLTQLRQIDECSAGFEQGLYPLSLLDDFIVRGEKPSIGAFRLLSFFLDGVTASGAKRCTGVCREHMLHESPMHIGQIVRRLAKGEAAAPGAEHMAALGLPASEAVRCTSPAWRCCYLSRK